MNSYECFLWGAAGSLIPEAIRLKNMIDSGISMPSFTPEYFCISLFFVICSGLFSLAWKPKSPSQAIMLGIAMPTTVNMVLKNTPPLPSGGIFDAFLAYINFL